MNFAKTDFRIIFALRGEREYSIFIIELSEKYSFVDGRQRVVRMFLKAMGG